MLLGRGGSCGCREHSALAVGGKCGAGASRTCHSIDMPRAMSMVLRSWALPVAGSITAAAPENACYGALCSHSKAAPVEANTPSVGPLPSASYPSLGTQMGYLGAGSPGAGHRWADTNKRPHPCLVFRNPEWFQGFREVGWVLAEVRVGVPH